MPTRIRENKVCADSVNARRMNMFKNKTGQHLAIQRRIIFWTLYKPIACELELLCMANLLNLETEHEHISVIQYDSTSYNMDY